MSSIPRPILGNNRFPGELTEIVDCEGITKFVPKPYPASYSWIDDCILIDSSLGIYARERACDTVFLSRDLSESMIVFLES